MVWIIPSSEGSEQNQISRAMPQHLDAEDRTALEERMYGDSQTGVVMVMGGLGSSQAEDSGLQDSSLYLSLVAWAYCPSYLGT